MIELGVTLVTWVGTRDGDMRMVLLTNAKTEGIHDLKQTACESKLNIGQATLGRDSGFLFITCIILDKIWGSS